MKQMKHFSHYLLYIVCLFTVAVSCSDEYSEGMIFTTDPHYLNVDKNSLNFTSSAGSQQIGIQSVGVSWTLSKSVDWISVDKTAGSTSEQVSVSVAENTVYSNASRSSSLTVSGSDKSRIVTITQESPALRLEVSPTEVTMPASASTNNISVESNADWTVDVALPWLTARQEGNSVVLQAGENTTGSELTNTVSIQGQSGKTVKVNVVQKAAVVEVAPQSLVFDYAADNTTINVTSEVSWIAECSDSWIHLSKTSGIAGSSEITVSVDANNSETERSGKFTIANIPVTVIQKAFKTDLSVSPDNVTINGKVSSTALTVVSNGTWEYKVSENDWLTATKSGNTLTLTAKENATTTTRSVFITFTSGTKTQTVEVKQLPASLEGLPDQIHFDGFEKSSKTYTIDSEAAWTATTNDSWIMLSPTSGKAGTTAFNVSVTDNISKTKRTNGSFTVNNKTVKVSQDAIILTPSVGALQFSESGETHQFSITSNTSWTVKASRDWIELDRKNGTGNATIKVTTGKNTDALRDGSITIESNNGISETINVTQDGMNMKPIVHQAFSMQGGDDVYDVSGLEFAKWTAEVESGVTWIHISPSQGSSSTKLTITVDKATGINDRSSYIDITFETGKRYRLQINQFGAGIITSRSSYPFFAKGGTSEAITVQHVGELKATCSESWLTASLNGDMLTLTAVKNLTNSARTASVSLNVVGTETTVVISVTQAGTGGVFNIDGFGSDENWN